MATTRASIAALACLVVLSLGMQVRDALFWRHMEATTYLHVSSGTYVRNAIWGAIILALGVLALRGSTIFVGLLALLMAWFARGSFATAGRLNSLAPGEGEIATWAQRSALFYLLLAAGFATHLVLTLLRRRRNHSQQGSQPK